MSDLLYVSDVSPYRAGLAAPAIAGVHQSLGSAARALEEIAGLCGLGFRQAQRVQDIVPADLEQARLLVLFTIGETPWSEAQREVVERRAFGGSLGIVGLHSATDAAYYWPAMGKLLGGRFNGHPTVGDLPITVVDRSHPATTHLPSPWLFRDELYLFRELVPDVRLLLAVEFGGSGVGTLPIAWCIERPPVRTFYTALGHFVAAYENADYLGHVLGGIRWVLDNDADAEPARSA
jgi:type 1 glutamine amidotransferase